MCARIRMIVLVDKHWKMLFSIAVFRVKVLECSAKDDTNITELFRTIVSLSRVLQTEGNTDSTSGLKRRSSAYVSATSKGQFCGTFFPHNTCIYISFAFDCVR